MKYTHFVDSRGLHIKMTAENSEETYNIMNIAEQTKKPVGSFGLVTETGAFMWLKIPLRKHDYKMNQFGNEKK